MPFGCVDIYSVKNYLLTALNNLNNELEKLKSGKISEVMAKQEALSTSIKAARDSINALFQAIEARKN